MDTVRVASVPFDDSDLRTRLVRELAAQGAIHLPGVLFAGTGTERRIATVLDPKPELTGQIEQAWLADPAVRWTGAWGTHLLQREGRPFLAAFVRVRWPDQRGFAAVWARVPGVAPGLVAAPVESAGSAEESPPAGRLFTPPPPPSTPPRRPR